MQVTFPRISQRGNYVVYNKSPTPKVDPDKLAFLDALSVQSLAQLPIISMGYGGNRSPFSFVEKRLSHHLITTNSNLTRPPPMQLKGVLGFRLDGVIFDPTGAAYAATVRMNPFANAQAAFAGAIQLESSILGLFTMAATGNASSSYAGYGRRRGINRVPSETPGSSQSAYSDGGSITGIRS